MSSDAIIDVSGVSKRYEIYAHPRDRLKQMFFPSLHRLGRRLSSAGRSAHEPVRNHFKEFWALHDISFRVRPGETVGIIGRNGSGKSTLLQILAGTLQPTTGTADVHGRVAALLELGSGFNPEFSGRENIYLNGQILGLRHREIESRFEQIESFADIGEFIDEPVKTYSSGMFVRLAFAVQAHLNASVVIIDEALAVGDVFFRQKCYGRLEQLRANGAAILLVTHSMAEVEQHCERAILLDHGHMLFDGRSSEAVKRYYLLEQAGRIPNAEAAPTATAGAGAGSASDDFPLAASIPIESLAQVNALGARCLRIAITDVSGAPRRTFKYGETMVVHHEYDLGAAAGIPVGGVVVHSASGTIIHGKNSVQTGSDYPAAVQPPARVCLRHAVDLMLAPGQYTFEVGLAVLPPTARPGISAEGFEQSRIRLVQVPGAAAFDILAPDAWLRAVPPFHGLTDLPTAISTTVHRCT